MRARQSYFVPWHSGPGYRTVRQRDARYGRPWRKPSEDDRERQGVCCGTFRGLLSGTLPRPVRQRWTAGVWLAFGALIRAVQDDDTNAMSLFLSVRTERNGCPIRGDLYLAV
ncbi:hypothetical protein BDN70DRAFT_873546 [Pholiota conissans]|uniref:Uncharacterized protein n=1 Tax=Pholiota conissans TaxID=109636 RepID=A0A9P5ZB95_9AGAR|nr:hypothetical protein BDN70DRAFT_873546 [Pholiota conissans]